jgi:hypothetical protein
MDRLRRYKVLLDGRQVSLIGRGERIVLPVEPGEHTLQLAIDWATSPPVALRVEVGEEVGMRCASNASPLTVLYWITFGRRRYLRLEPEARSGTPQPAGA